MNKNNKALRRNADTVDFVLSVRRVVKVVKGGSRFAFSVLVVTGDRRGRIGIASAKDKEVNGAKIKAIKLAQRSMLKVILKDGKSLHHDIKGKFSASTVILKSAKPGTGVIAGGTISSMCECLGIHDIVAKSIGSNNPYNVARATINALQASGSPKQIAERRGIKVSALLSRKMLQN